MPAIRAISPRAVFPSGGNHKRCCDTACDSHYRLFEPCQVLLYLIHIFLHRLMRRARTICAQSIFGKQECNAKCLTTSYDPPQHISVLFQ